MTENDWIEFTKLVELVRTHKVRTLETKVGEAKVKIYWVGRTTHIELRDAK